MTLTAVVLNFNGLKDTIECIRSLKKCHSGPYKLNIVVVDNGSDDKNVASLSQVNDITLIRNNRNLGYSGGNNVGIKYALGKNSDLIILLNNDIIVDQNLLQYLAKASRGGDLIAPKIYFEKGFEFHKDLYKKEDLGKVIWYAGGKIDWQNIGGIHIGVDEVDRGQFSKGLETDFATGACMLVKSEVFKKIGYFDEKYFLYLEDLDFCVRAKKAGFKIVFEPKAIAWHKNAASAGGSGSSLQDYYITRNRLLFAFKFARFRTKIAVLKQVLFEISKPVRRWALLDFLTGRFKKGSI